MTFIAETTQSTLNTFFNGHKQPTDGNTQFLVDFSPELANFGYWFLDKFGGESQRLLSEFLATCRGDYERQAQGNQDQFLLPNVCRGNCMRYGVEDRWFVDFYGLDELETDLELAAEKLTHELNQCLRKTRKAYFHGLLNSALVVYQTTHSVLQADIGLSFSIRFFSDLESISSQNDLSFLLMLKSKLELESLELAKDVLAVHLVTHYKLLPTSKAYRYSDKLLHTRRQLLGIQGAYKKVANALAAIDRASKDGNESKEDAIKNLNDISANFAAILNMTPVSGNTEEESS